MHYDLNECSCLIYLLLHTGPRSLMSITAAKTSISFLEIYKYIRQAENQFLIVCLDSSSIIVEQFNRESFNFYRTEQYLNK